MKHRDEELYFSKNGYIFSSDGFAKQSDIILMSAKSENREICRLKAIVFENNNILIEDLFTDPSYRREGIADIVVSTFVETIRNSSNSINIYTNAVSCNECFPQEKLVEFYRKQGIIVSGAYAGDWAQANYIPKD